MKRTICAVAFVLSLGTTCWAQMTASFSTYYEGKRYDSILTKEMLDQTPDWSEEAETPPISPRRAGQIALQVLATLVADANTWRKREIRLSRIGEKWLYVVEFIEPPLMKDGAVHDGLVLHIGPRTTFKLLFC